MGEWVKWAPEMHSANPYILRGCFRFPKRTNGTRHEFSLSLMILSDNT
ncbi:hypothetical protein PHO31112_01788 [Pandoraea horticolens]|uniref:Uncharacterized protein n=1 Tax=Pandoraea horticolens TaxID=2508298 RepID=A0A5E4U2V1_9BURK|nr:hypothetical protein PHO31112_01788 [Pandoraea horticolens]